MHCLTPDFLSSVPTSPGVYFMLDSSRRLLYIGKAVNLRSRLRDYTEDGYRPDLIRRLHEVRWQECADDDAALLRETDLIQAIRPPFNRSSTYDVDYLYLSVAPGPVHRFVLGESPAGGRVYGAFPHLAKGKANHAANRCKMGYQALLRLLWAAQATHHRFEFPSRICGLGAPLEHEGAVSGEWREPLHRFLLGRNAALPARLYAAALANPNVEPYRHIALARDRSDAEEFYLYGPRGVREIRDRHALGARTLSTREINELLIGEVRELLGAVKLPRRRGRPQSEWWRGE